MNRIRLFSSGILLLFAVYCLIAAPDLPFSMPTWVYVIGTVYFAVFPIKQTRVEPDTVLSDEFPPILRQKCSKCASISPLSFLSRQKFIRLKLRRT